MVRETRRAGVIAATEVAAYGAFLWLVCNPECMDTFSSALRERWLALKESFETGKAMARTHKEIRGLEETRG